MLTRLFKLHIIGGAILLLALQTPAMAKDTDIYQSNVKQNCYILLDNSGSMGFGVYESNIDYSAMYDYLWVLNSNGTTDYLKDTGEAIPEHFVKDNIYLVTQDDDSPYDLHVVSRGSGDDEVIFTGDAGNYNVVWDTASIFDTGATLGENNIIASDVLSVNSNKHIEFNGATLPLSQDIEITHSQNLYGGSVIKDGFADLLKAPGYHFSGFNKVVDTTIDAVTVTTYSYASDSTGPSYFFVTGNWLNFQQIFNLVYTTSNPTPTGAHTGDEVWNFEYYNVDGLNVWQGGNNYSYSYPETATEYAPNVNETKIIKYTGAQQLRIHFSKVDVNPNKAPSQKGDWITIKDSSGDVVASYNNDNMPAEGDIDAGWWSETIEGGTAIITFTSDSTNTGTGFTINGYEFKPYGEEGYKIKDRLTIAKSSMLNTIDEFRGEINWGTFTFADGDGAKSQQVINPNLTDDATRQNIAANFANIAAAGGTPIGEALQDVFEVGYYQHKTSIDNLPCRKNYAIVLSDGFPSLDFDWERIDDVPRFTDADGDGFTADPSQYPSESSSFYEVFEDNAADNADIGKLPNNYYDDVAHWMYTHSWLDKTYVDDPESSYVNVSSHQISFGFQNPLMQDAAEEAGGLYITAYNEGQLNAAFQAIGLAMSDAVSFTAPVVSVDAANKIQNGDDLYMGQFIPMDAGYWPGNLKKFKLGDGSTDRPLIWQMYDANNNEATKTVCDDDDAVIDPDTGTCSTGASSEVFKAALVGFWQSGDGDFSNLPIHHDGVGEVLTTRVKDNIELAPYGRNIKTLTTDGLVLFDPGNIAPEVVGIPVAADASEEEQAAADAMRDKIINWVHGYTFDANSDGTPVEARDWALGAIIHSRPTVIDYYGEDADYSTLDCRLIAVGADDGMLHVFLDKGASEDLADFTLNDDTEGAEVFAYIPTVILPELKQMETESHISMVDGFVKLYRENGQPKYLFVGLRRGGKSYICIDVAKKNPNNWTVKEITTADIPELGQTWSDITFSKIQTGVDTYRNVAIFSGGYDETEDNYPEPFNDLDNNGTPYTTGPSGKVEIDGDEWDEDNPEQDFSLDGNYTIANSEANDSGNGVFVVDLDDTDLPVIFSVTYGVKNIPEEQNTFATIETTTTQTRTDMKYCFPATPSVVSLAQVTDGVRVDNILTAIYAPDIYGNLFRIVYDYNAGSPQWQVAKLFSAKPASSSESSEIWGGYDYTDIGRKVFYGPAVSWRGSGRYFDQSNYNFTGYTFEGTNKIASLFFGTGDRVHPTYQLVKNRVYAIYDDIPVTADDGNIKISPALDPVELPEPYTEDDLLNITCDELGINTLQKVVSSPYADTWAFKAGLQTFLTDDVNNAGVFEDPSTVAENDAKGWYIILQDQGSTPYCDHCEYAAVVDYAEGGRDYHVGEKILSKLTLFAGNLYFTSYQPAYDNPCEPEGNAFAYSLNYLDGSAGLNLNSVNDLNSGDDPLRKDVTDRYGKYSGVKGIPSGFEVVIRGGEAGAMASLGGGIIGGGEDGFEIPYEDSGISLYYWIEK